MPSDGVERIINLRGRVRNRLRENAEVVGTDEAFFEDDEDDQPIINLYNERSGILDGEADSEVDLTSHAYQIWKNATTADPRLERAVAALPDVVFSSRQHHGDLRQPEGTLVYLRTADDNDALAYVGRDGRSHHRVAHRNSDCRAMPPRHAGTPPARGTPPTGGSRSQAQSPSRRVTSVGNWVGPAARVTERTTVSRSMPRGSKANCLTAKTCDKPSTTFTATIYVKPPRTR